MISSPIVVVNNFLTQSDHHEEIYRRISEWAAILAMGNIAHVIFITDEIGFSKVLTDVLPNQTLKTIYVGDATPEVAREFVLKHMQPRKEGPEKESDSSTEAIEESIASLGGRMTDLQNLVRRISIGESPESMAYFIKINRLNKSIPESANLNRSRKWNDPTERVGHLEEISQTQWRPGVDAWTDLVYPEAAGRKWWCMVVNFMFFDDSITESLDTI